MKLGTLGCLALIFFSSSINAEPIDAEISYGLVSAKFSDASRTDPTIQFSLGKLLNNSIRIKLGYAQLGRYSLYDTSGDTPRDSKVELRSGSLSITKSLDITNSIFVEYGIGVIRWEAQRTYDDGSSSITRDNELQVIASAQYRLDSSTSLGFMFTETNSSIANLRTLSCTMKTNFDI